MVRAVSRQPLTAEDRDCAWVGLCLFCVGQSGRDRSFSEFFGFPVSISRYRDSAYHISITWRMNSRPIGGRISEI
jgi:hypothetical protein